MCLLTNSIKYKQKHLFIEIMKQLCIRLFLNKNMLSACVKNAQYQLSEKRTEKCFVGPALSTNFIPIQNSPIIKLQVIGIIQAKMAEVDVIIPDKVSEISLKFYAK